jgi:dephospho-CoA kinase
VFSGKLLVSWALEVLYYYLTDHWAVALDIPLLFESGLDIFYGAVVMVAVSDPAIQMKRLQERDPYLSPEDAENRVKSQGDVREKAKRAETRSANGRGCAVWNDGGKEDLQHELERVMEGCSKVSPQWWAWMLLFMPPLVGTLGVWSALRAWRERRKWQAVQNKERAKLRE